MHEISDNGLRDEGREQCMILIHEAIPVISVLVHHGVDGASGLVGFAPLALF